MLQRFFGYLGNCDGTRFAARSALWRKIWVGGVHVIAGQSSINSAA